MKKKSADNTNNSHVYLQDNKFKALIENSSDAIALINKRGKVLYTSPSIERVLGYKEKKFTGINGFTRVHPHDLPMVMKEMAKLLLKKGSTTTIEVRVKHKNGSYIWLEVNGTNMLHDPNIKAIVANFRNITQRKDALEKLRASEERFKALFQNSADVIVLVNEKAQRIHVSPSVKKVFGRTPEEHKNHNAFYNCHPDDRKRLKEVFKELLKSPRKNIKYQFRAKHENGQWRWIDSTAINLLDAPYINAIVVNYRDITDQKNAEIDMARAAALITSSGDAVVTKTLDGTITSWNPAAEKLFGYKKSEIVGKNIRTIIPDDLQKEEDVIISKLKKGQIIDHYDTVRKRKDGSNVFVSLSISTIKNSYGKIIGAAKIARDVSAKKTQDERQQFLETVSNILSSSIDYETTLKNIAKIIVPYLADYTRIVLIDDNKLVKEVAVNHKDPNMISIVRDLYATYGGQKNQYGVDSLVSKKRPEIMAHATIKDLGEYTKENKELGKILKKLGLVSYMGVPMMSRNKVIGAITFSSTTPGRFYNKEDLEFAKEITRRAAAAVENALLYMDSQKATKLRDEFLGIASHELKTPVTSLKAFGQVLYNRSLKHGDSQSAGLLKKMDAQVNRLTTLIQDLLDVTKIEEGRMQFYEEQFAFDELVDDIIEEVQRTTNKQKIYKVNFTGKNIYGDKDRVGQVITNLLTNAIKYSPNSDKIIVALSTSNGSVICSVQDFGVGIAQEKLKHVFERFYRETGRKEITFPGLGLGLYISSEIIKRQGGKIWAESKQGYGSIFSFSLPIYQTKTIRKAKNLQIEKQYL